MSELERLLVSSDDDVERALLGSLMAERPLPTGLRDTALALGLTLTTANALAASLPAASSVGAALSLNATTVAAPVSATTTAAATATAAATSAATTTAATVATTVGAASLATLGKSLIVGTIVSFAALTTVDFTLGSPASSPSVAALAARAVPQDAPPAAPAVISGAPFSVSMPEAPAAAQPRNIANPPAPRRAEASPETPTPAEVAAPAGAAFEPPPHVEPPAKPVANAASLAAETRQLDRVRAALAAGNTDQAARALDAYAAARPSPVLAQEAAVLRVRLLLARGQRAAAAEQARRTIALHPESAHVESLRRLAAEP